MAIELISRPIGHKLGTSDIDANIYDDGTGDAYVYVGTGHGLSDGDYVFIDSDFDRYNGYFLVDSVSYDYFKIKVGTEYVEYIQDASIVYRVASLNHGYQCVHLPIVYELKSNLWPNNIAEETYTPVTVFTQENVNGYTKLNLSTAISGLTDLNYIELIGGSVPGAYQIIDVVQPWAIVINLAYSASNTFSQVVNYYNTYAINVNVYAGYAPGHRWEAIKPYELAATLKLIPDSEGKVKFSIAEILKGYIKTRNNLTLDTLPNNTDFSVGFYIAYFETYDQSDGTEISTFTGTVTTDSFEGTAINAMLPFKSIDSGFMSEYIQGQWLTTMARPVAFVDRYFDISFLNIYDYFDIQILNNGVLFMTIPNPGSGVIRVGFTPETGVVEYCLKAMIDGSISPDQIDLATGVNELPGTADWTISSTPSASPGGAFVSAKRLTYTYAFIPELSYTFTFNYTRSGAGSLQFLVFDEDGNIVVTDNNIFGSAGTGNSSAAFTSTSAMRKVAFTFTGNITITINSITVTASATDVELTETICIDVIDECSPSYINDNLRITEGGDFRELE